MLIWKCLPVMRQGLPLLCGQDNLHLVLIILGLELPIPLFKIAYQVFSGGMERKLACISEMHKSAQDQLNSTFIHAWEQELCINWLLGVCALPQMLWKWNWLSEALHGEGRIRAKGLKDLEETILCSTAIFLFGAPKN